jgi:hypothetical protein
MAKQGLGKRIKEKVKKFVQRKEPRQIKPVRSPKTGKEPPICRKCGKPHWGFSACADRPPVDRKVPWQNEDRMVSVGGKIVPARKKNTRPFQE